MKTKNKAKIILMTILAIGCLITPMLVQGKVTKLVFYAESTQTLFQPLQMWFEEDIMHLIFYKEAVVIGTINGIEFEGNLELNFYLKMDPTGDMVGHGSFNYYIYWEEMSGYFSGIVNAKKVDGVMQAKFVCQGFGDYNGWKLFGDEWTIGGLTNGQLGTILIPN